MKVLTSSKDLFNYITSSLQGFTKQEESSIAFLLMNKFLQVKKIDVLVNTKIRFTEPRIFDEFIARINSKEPVQYVLGETDFYGRTFKVNKSVLIPRPETEELVEHIVQSFAGQKNLKVLDLCTGSGCIVVSLAKELQTATATGLDISREALEIATFNAHYHHAPVEYIKADVLALKQQLEGPFDIIVSNPPYVLPSEKPLMEENVLNFEPSIALFVPEHDPLLFYKSIADVAYKNLSTKGKLFFEINSAMGPAIEAMLVNKGFNNVLLLKDLNNKDRFAICQI